MSRWSAIDNAAKLALRQTRRGDWPVREFRPDQGPDLRIPVLAAVQLTMSAPDELLRGLTEIGDHVRDDPFGYACP